MDGTDISVMGCNGVLGEVCGTNHMKCSHFEKEDCQKPDSESESEVESTDGDTEGEK